MNPIIRKIILLVPVIDEYDLDIKFIELINITASFVSYDDCETIKFLRKDSTSLQQNTL